MKTGRVSSLIVAVLALCVVGCGGAEAEDSQPPLEHGSEEQQADASHESEDAAGIGQIGQDLKADCSTGGYPFAECGIWDVRYGCKGTNGRVIWAKKEFCLPCATVQGDKYTCGFLM